MFDSFEIENNVLVNMDLLDFNIRDCMLEVIKDDDNNEEI